MQLYTLSSQNFRNVFGEPMNPTGFKATIVGQKEDCSSFVLYADEANEALEACDDVSGYVFTFCQEWGLHINEEQLSRVRRALRTKEVDAIVVDVNGKLFDGYELAQDRISRAVAIMEEDDITVWKLYDNSFATVTKAELKEALKLSGMKQTELWAKYV